MGSRSVNLGLGVKEGGLVALHGKHHSLGESAGSACPVSTDDAICYISECVCVMFMCHLFLCGVF